MKACFDKKMAGSLTCIHKVIHSKGANLLWFKEGFVHLVLTE
jgi:hypothetical protein